MKMQIEIRGYEQGKIEGIQKAIEIIKEWNRNKGHPYPLLVEKDKIEKLIQKLNQEKEK